MTRCSPTGASAHHRPSVPVRAGLPTGLRDARRRRVLRDVPESTCATLRDSASMTTDRPADLVLRGGRIATMDSARSWATAVAVRDGRVVAVGPDAVVADLIGERSRVIELHGHTVTPGFQDAHVHPVHGGLS